MDQGLVAAECAYFRETGNRDRREGLKRFGGKQKRNENERRIDMMSGKQH